jgi:hypothetical protein
MCVNNFELKLKNYGTNFLNKEFKNKNDSSSDTVQWLGFVQTLQEQ